MAGERNRTREGETVIDVECRCGQKLVRRSDAKQCQRCNKEYAWKHRIVLIADGALPHPDEWVRL